MSNIWKMPGKWSRKLLDRFPKGSDTASESENAEPGNSRYIVSTRPVEKFEKKKGGSRCCYSLVNIPLTELSDREFSTGDIDEIVKFAPESVVLTSSHGAEIFFSQIQPKLGEPVKTFYCVGPSTAKVVEAKGFSCFVPDERDSDGLGNLLWDKARRQRLLLFRSGQANKALDDRLRSSGFTFLSSKGYDVIPNASPETEKFLDENCFGIIFTSAMEVDALLKGKSTGFCKKVAEGRKIFSIGKFTTEKLSYYGIEVAEPVGNSDFDELVGNICSSYCQ